jgi:glutathione S-transferase
MILIGQYDSPFVRRVGIALTLYGLPFEHRPWSAFGDADKIRAYNPLVRVPTLVLDDSLFYERRLHKEASEVWVDRCRAQISAALAVLEADRAGRAGDYWFGDRIGHADIAVAAAIRFFADAHPGLLPLAQFPTLTAHAARLESLPVFQKIAQPFIPPA